MSWSDITKPTIGNPVSKADFGDKVVDNFAVLKQMGKGLPIGAWRAPISGLTAAALEVGQSSGAGTNKVEKYQLRFDAAAVEGRQITFVLPLTYGGNPVLRLRYRMASANSSKAVVMAAQVAAVSDTDASVDAKVFATENTAIISVPDAANTQDEADITLTNADSMAAGDEITIVLYRKGSDGSDTASGDLILTGAEFRFGPN